MNLTKHKLQQNIDCDNLEIVPKKLDNIKIGTKHKYEHKH